MAIFRVNFNVEVKQLGADGRYEAARLTKEPWGVDVYGVEDADHAVGVVMLALTRLIDDELACLIPRKGDE
jgi:hypothetical protein